MSNTSGFSNSDKPLDVVAVGAHPDDVEVACGGTLSQLVRQGYRVGIVDLTDGEPTPECPHPDVRREEARNASAALGIHERVILDFPNRRLFDGFNERVALAKQLRRFRPQVVIGFGGKTPAASPDHWQAMQITDAAVFYARLTKWEEHFDGLPVHAVQAQLYFTSPFEPPSSEASSGQFVVDISDTIEQKMQAIACYETQFHAAKRHLLDGIRQSSAFVGTSAGFAAGELFVSTRRVGTCNLMAQLGLARESHETFQESMIKSQ